MRWRSVYLAKGVESGVGVVLRLGHPDVLQSALGLGLLALRQPIEHVGRLVHPAALTAGLGPHLLDGLPEPERAVGNRELRPDHQLAPLEVEHVEFISEGAYATHIRRTRRIYARRLAFLLAQRDRLSGLLELSPASAGMHVVADLAPELARHMSDREAAKRAREAGVTTPPLADFYALSPRRSGLLLGFAGFSEEACALAVGRLAGALSRH